MWNDKLWEKFNCCFSRVFFASINEIYIFGGGLGNRLLFDEVLELAWYLLIF